MKNDVLTNNLASSHTFFFVQASGRVSDGATDLTSVGEESSIDTKEKTAVDTVMDVDTTLQQTQDLTISRIDEKQQQNRPKKSISSTKLGEHTLPDAKLMTLEWSIERVENLL